MWTLFKIWWTGMKDGLQSHLQLSSGITFEEEQRWNESYDRGVNFGQRITNLFYLRGFRADWQLEKQYNWERWKNCWWAFLALNALTVFISPVSNPGLISRESYMPFMWVKVLIVALLLLFGLYMKVSSKFCSV